MQLPTYQGNRSVPQSAFVVPMNFALVTKGVYRSAYPTEANVPYLRSIGIRTVATLSIEPIPDSVRKLLKEDPAAGSGGRSSAIPSTAPSTTSVTPTRTLSRSGPLQSSGTPRGSSSVVVVNIADMQSWQRDCLNSNDDFSQKDVIRALDFAVDTQWHPLLLCCPTGELQTSVVVGCMRRYLGWSLASIYGECELFANLQETLRVSLMCFVDAWRPEDYPISKTDIMSRNSEWLKERAQHALQLRRRQRRMQRQQQQLQHPSGGGAGRGPRSPTQGSRRVSDDSSSATDEGSSEDAGNSGRSSLIGAGVVSSGELKPAGAPAMSAPIALASDEAALLTGSGQRPAFAWRRRGRVSAGDDVPATPPGDRDDDARQSLANPNAIRSVFALRGGLDGGVGKDLLVKEIVYADWFEEARRINPACCIDAACAEFPSSVCPVSPVLSTSVKQDEKRKSGASAAGKDTQCADERPPHVRYAGVRNPPVLDARSTFTKESIVDDDDD